MIKKITIPYFPKGLKYVTPIVFSASIYLAVLEYKIWSGLLMLLCIIVLTTKYVTEINLKDKKYRDYLSFLWLPLNEESNEFNTVDRIVITKGNYAQTINTRAQSRQLDWSDYTGTLIFDNNTLDLLTRNDKKDLIRGPKEFAEFLQVGVEDRSTSHYYWVDLTKI